MYHAGGLTVFMTPLFAIGGTSFRMMASMPPRYYKLFRLLSARILFGVPTIFKMLFDSPEFAALDVSHLRQCASGGAPLPLQLLGAYQERGLIFRQGYGPTRSGRTALP